MAKNKTNFTSPSNAESEKVVAEVLDKASASVAPKKKEVVLGKLVSKVKFPVNITYNGESVRMSPKATFKNIDKSLLKEPTPLGVMFIPNNK